MAALNCCTLEQFNIIVNHQQAWLLKDCWERQPVNLIGISLRMHRTVYWIAIAYSDQCGQVDICTRLTFGRLQLMTELERGLDNRIFQNLKIIDMTFVTELLDMVIRYAHRASHNHIHANHCKWKEQLLLQISKSCVNCPVISSWNPMANYCPCLLFPGIWYPFLDALLLQQELNTV